MKKKISQPVRSIGNRTSNRLGTKIEIQLWKGRVEDSMEKQNFIKENSSRPKDKDFLRDDLKPSDYNIEIWDDLVSIKDLVKALSICIITTFCGYFLSPSDSYKPLLFGLVGAIVGFLISSFIIKPKREFIQEN